MAASLSASLPSQALRASSPKGRALGEEEKPHGISKASPKGRALGEEAKPHGISKASPFGRGVTEGDGEGKPVRGEPLTQR